MRKSSKYTGIYWNKSDRRWQARAKINKQRHYIGNFLDELTAAKMYDKFIKWHGIKRKLNFN